MRLVTCEGCRRGVLGASSGSWVLNVLRVKDSVAQETRS